MQLDPNAYRLFHKGTLALSKIESNGIRIDVDLLHKNINRVSNRITLIEEDIKEDEVYKIWEKQYGNKTNVYSGTQLAKILFEDLGYECKEWTPKGKPKVAKSTLSTIDLPFLRMLENANRLQDVRGTFLNGILRETWGGFLHCSYNLHLARSFRSSSDNINFQNFPTRDEDSAKWVRGVFIPREDRQLCEVDFKGIEVCVFGDYCKDKAWIRDVSDPARDMHRDMAIEIFMLEDFDIPKDWWKDKAGGKNARYCVKNMFVFPEFYGDWYKKCAINLWEAADRFKLTAPDGTPIKDHLRSKGIKKLGLCATDKDAIRGTFEYHIKQKEDYFWNTRYPTATKWKKSFFQKYLDTGSFRMFTGFTCEGVFNKKEVVNYPVQGSAFHILLYTIIKLQKWLEDNDMETLIVGQIHDSMLMDMVPEEKDRILAKIHHIVKVEIPSEWKWIIVPMEVEVEIAPINRSWFEKSPIKV